jgi:hypothetical protein
MAILKTARAAFRTRLLSLVLVVPFAACNNSRPPVTGDVAAPPKPSIQVFASPEEAGDALLSVAKSGDQAALSAIFGPDTKDVILSGDPVQDKNAGTAFVAGYAAMHRWRKLLDDSQILLVGAENFPFPIPLKKNADGKWFFDTAAGKDEILARRIGRNELAVIDICAAIADAQAEYFAQPHDGLPGKRYAVKFISDDGKQNGLYWHAAEGQPDSPLGPLAAFASAEGYKANPNGNGHTPFHGYYFQMLKGQTDKAPGGAKEYAANGNKTAGFAFIAFPADYGNSGVMSFMMNQDGVLLQKDLGKNTNETATAMSEFDPDSDWVIVEE